MNDCKNLMPDFRDASWVTYEPPFAKKTEFSVLEDGQSASIRTNKDYSLGKWICTVPVVGGAFYDFTASCKTELEEFDAFLIVTQYDEKGRMPIREHIKDTVREGEYLRFSDKLDIAENTVKLSVELWAKGKDAHAVWERPSLKLSEALPERKVKAAAAHLNWNSTIGATPESRKEIYLKMTDEAGEYGADILVFCEGTYSGSLGLSLPERAREMDGKMLALLRGKAAKHNMYIVFNGVEEDDGLYYNTSFLLGRNGELIGKYRKTHITVFEYELGYNAGDELPVFDLDFGKVGLLICYDQFFPETAKVLAKKGAEIICIPTVGDDHHSCMSLAMNYGVHLVVAGRNKENNYGWGPTRIVNPLGALISHTETNMTLATAEIDLNKKVRRFWMSTGPALSSVHDDYRYEVNPRSINK